MTTDGYTSRSRIMSDGTKVLLAGDIHGDYRHFKYLVKTAVEHGCDKLVALGDFGYWPDSGEVGFLERCNYLCGRYDIHLYWLDGNHENHHELATHVKPMFDEPQLMMDNVTFLARGARWEWAGRSLMSFGGAYSIDQGWRVEGFDWFPEELPSVEQQNFALDAGTVDILLTHDAPFGTVPFINEAEEAELDQYPLSRENRIWTSALIDSCQPKAVFHGHMHGRWAKAVQRDWGFYTVDALNCNGTGPKSWVILNLE